MTYHNPNPWVVIPTYNEKKNIARMIDALFALSVNNLSVLIVDDTSPDGTYQIVTDLQKQYPQLHLLKRTTKDGLGRAYVAGFSHAINKGATSIVQMDADFSHNPKDIPRLLRALDKHSLVLGSRYCQGLSVINWPMRRLILSTMANTYARLITGLPFKDVTGGFRAWRPAALQSINLNKINVDGYGFQIALTYKTWKKNYPIKEIPIIFTERQAGQSKMSKSIIFEAIWLVWKLRLFG